jgi:hypothetical protein
MPEDRNTLYYDCGRFTLSLFFSGCSGAKALEQESSPAAENNTPQTGSHESASGPEINNSNSLPGLASPI